MARSVLQRALDGWIRFLLRHAAGVVVLGVLSVAFCLDYTARHFELNSDTGALIRQDAPFRQDYDALYEAFPQLEGTTAVVVSGASRESVTDATDRLAARLRGDPALFRSVFAPGEGSFFWDHALLYADVDELPTSWTGSSRRSLRSRAWPGTRACAASSTWWGTASSISMPRAS